MPFQGEIKIFIQTKYKHNSMTRPRLHELGLFIMCGEQTVKHWTYVAIYKGIELYRI